MSAPSLRGYRRPDGSVGVRNHVLVLSVTGLTTPTARRIARAVPHTKLVTTGYGSGLMGEDSKLQRRTLAALGRHPNVAATVVIGATPPLVQELRDDIASSGKPTQALVLDECNHDAITLTERGTRIAAHLVHDASRVEREPIELRNMFLAMECGRSDPSSGIAANPLVGAVVDALIAAGGRAVFGETIEWLGAEHLLAGRAVDAKVAQSINAAVQRREREAVAAGMDLLGNNPGPTNIAAGLSSIEEKSLGAIAKGGHSPIAGVIAMAEVPLHAGLYAMDAPAYAPESVTGLVAAGAQIVLFTTGVGNSYVSTLAPTIKISANPVAARSLTEQIDFDASALFAGKESLESAAQRLQHLVLEVASGALTWGEILDEGDEVISRLGPAL